MSSATSSLKKYYVVYTDGACKDNHVDPSTAQRRAGASMIVLPKLLPVEENLKIVWTDYLAKRPIDAWRTMLVQQKDAFSTVVCRAIPLISQNKDEKISNNRAELLGFNSALAHFVLLRSTLPCLMQIEFYIDSQYVIKVFNNAHKWQKNGWKISSGSQASNIDYVLEMLQYVDLLQKLGHQLIVRHILAHSKESEIPTDFENWQHWFGNDMADRLSNIAAGVETDINYSVQRKKRKIITNDFQKIAKRV